MMRAAKSGDIDMKKVDAERGAMLCAAYFITEYETMLPSCAGVYSADFDVAIDGVPVTLSCSCTLSCGRHGGIESFRFRIEGKDGGEDVEVEGAYREACKSAAHFINRYLRLLTNNKTVAARRQ